MESLNLGNKLLEGVSHVLKHVREVSVSRQGLSTYPGSFGTSAGLPVATRS